MQKGLIFLLAALPVISGQCDSHAIVLNSDTGNINNLDYKNNMNCKWIVAPTGVSYVTLSFLSFSTESYDRVRIFSCTSILCDATHELEGSPYSGSDIPSPVTSYTGIMMVTFSSDPSVTLSGWIAIYTSGRPQQHSDSDQKIKSEVSGTKASSESDNLSPAGVSCENGDTAMTLMVWVGGILGFLLLFARNGYSFKPRPRLHPEDTFENEQGNEVRKQAIREQINQYRQEQVDFADGLDDGELGVLAQWLVFYWATCQPATETGCKERRAIATAVIAGSFLRKILLRLVLFIPLARRASVASYMMGFDALALIYFGLRRQYCPGSLYNDIHVMLTGKRFLKKCPFDELGVSTKLYLGLTGIATLSGLVGQTDAIACLVNAARPSPSQVMSGLLAFMGLLNIRGAAMASVACFLYCWLWMCFCYHCCCKEASDGDVENKNTGLVSRRGTLEFTVWEGLYECIEDSSLNDFLKALQAFGCIPASQPHATTAQRAQAKQIPIGCLGSTLGRVAPDSNHQGLINARDPAAPLPASLSPNCHQFSSGTVVEELAHGTSESIQRALPRYDSEHAEPPPIPQDDLSVDLSRPEVAEIRLPQRPDPARLRMQPQVPIDADALPGCPEISEAK